MQLKQQLFINRVATLKGKKKQLFWLIKVIFYILLGPAQKLLPQNKLTNIYLKDKDLIFKLI